MTDACTVLWTRLFQSDWKIQTRILRLRGIVSSYVKEAYRLLNGGPAVSTNQERMWCDVALPNQAECAC